MVDMLDGAGSAEVVRFVNRGVLVEGGCDCS
jgi:hypothetical protein